MSSSIKIGRSTYTVTSSARRANTSGQMQTYTDMKGRRGASVTMIETDGSEVVTLIHFGRNSPAQRVHRDSIVRA